MDLVIFQSFNDLAGVHPLLDQTLILLASPLAYVLAGITALAFFFPRLFAFTLPSGQARLIVAAAVVAAFISRYVVKELVVLVYNSPRPFDILPEVVQLVPHESFASFPSGHAIFFATLATVIILTNRRFGLFLILASLAMVLSRVAVGIHWPSDVLFGISLGILLGAVTHWLVEYGRGRGVLR